MIELEKLYKDIQNRLNNKKVKHKRLKICKYCLKCQK